MKVVLSTLGKFHTFDLARQLQAHHALTAIFTGYPRFKLNGENLPPDFIHTYPWFRAPFMVFPWKNRLPTSVLRQWETLAATTFESYVAKHLPACDLYVGLSGTALAAGKKAHQRGAKFVCDRGSAHIAEQNRLLLEEHAYWGIAYDGIDPRAIQQEQAEYAEADVITVPSRFAFRSFVSQGVSADKLRLLPYGVNLERFHPAGQPDEARFDLLFVGGMSLRKGLPYLVQAYQQLQHPKKSLTFIGGISPQLIKLLRLKGLWSDDIQVLGHVDQAELKHWMSRSHALVLPSVEDGFGMVMAQAMACGCPVVASQNTGAEDLFTDAVEGYIVSARDAEALQQRLQQLADNTDLQKTMAQRAREKVQHLGGWQVYGTNAMSIYSELVH